MLFWLIVLTLSLVLTVGVAAPLVRMMRGNQQSQPPPKLLRAAGLVALIAAPLVAALIYLQIGAPESLSPEFRETVRQSNPAEAIAALPDDERAAVIENMIEGLAARLATEPDDVEGWRMLARSYGVQGRAQESAESAAAYRELVTRDANATIDDWRNYAAALLSARTQATGSVDDETVNALTKLSTLQTDDPLALFYLGVAARDRGDIEAALSKWRRLSEILPGDAALRPMLDQFIEETSAVAPGE